MEHGYNEFDPCFAMLKNSILCDHWSETIGWMLFGVTQFTKPPNWFWCGISDPLPDLSGAPLSFLSCLINHDNTHPARDPLDRATRRPIGPKKKKKKKIKEGPMKHYKNH